MIAQWYFEIGAHRISMQPVEPLDLVTTDGDFLVTTDGDQLVTAETYIARVLPDSFAGITMRWDMSRKAIISPSEIQFDVDNHDATYSRSDFEGEECLVTLAIDHVPTRRWRFVVKTAVPAYGKIKLHCVDLLQEYIVGDYPLTKHPREVFPHLVNDPANENLDDYRIPKIFGKAYIPVMWINDGVSTYGSYVLGADSDYSITSVKMPPEYGENVYRVSEGYTFTQTTLSGLRTAIFYISPQEDGTYTDGMFPSHMLPLVEYEKSSGSTTNPASILASVLAEIGVSEDRVDLADSWAIADANYTTYGISWNGGFYRARPREQVLNSLLTQADSLLYSGEKIELRMFTADVKETFDTSKVKRLSFRPARRTKSGHDSGHVSWAEDGQPQTSLPGKAIVPVSATTDNPDSEIFACPFINDSELAQDLGILYFRRKLTAKDTVSFDSSGDKLSSIANLKPGDVVRINDSLYGEDRLLIIQSLTIKKDLTVSISGDTYTSVQDLSDMTSTPIAIATDEISPTFPMPTYGAEFGTNIKGGGSSNNQVGNDGFVTYIDADIIVAGSLTSTNWDADNGSQFALLDGTFKLGGASNPKLEWDGDELTIVGNISATTGEIGGWTVGTNALTADDITIDSNIPAILMGSATDYMTGTGIFQGKNSDTYRIHIGNPLGDHLKFDGTNLYISGEIESGSAISGTATDTFTINNDLDDVTAKLIFGRTTGGNAEITWNGTVISLDKDTTFANDVSITGNLIVLGTEFIANVETVQIKDNLAIINYGETGAGVTAGFAGWEADRGTLTNYKWGFDETTDTWRVGEDGSLQAIATRSDSPNAMGLAYWNDTAKRLDTLSSVTVSAGGKITAVDLNLTTPSDVYNLDHDSFSGFVSNEHINHAGVTITAGDGLTGGGTIAATRTLAMGTPSTLTNATVNGVTATSHTHAITNYAVSGTVNQVTVTGAGKVLGSAITLSLPQNIHTGASPTFADLTISTPSAIYSLNHDSFSGFVGNEHIDHTTVILTAGDGLVNTGTGNISASRTFTLGTPGTLTSSTTNGVTSESHTHAVTNYSVSGTANQVTVTGAGKVLGEAITLSLPQDIHSAASPTFVTAKLSALTDGYLPYHVSDASGLADGPIYTDGTNLGLGTTDLTEIFNVAGNIALDGDLGFIGAQSITTSLDSLTLSPADTLLLSPTNSVQTDSDIETDNFVSQTTGWQVSYSGNADFRNIYADELHVKAFIADVYSALAGGLIITKSRAEITRDFTIPDTGLTATLYVSDHEGVAETAVFVAGDYVRLRVLDRSGGGLIVADVYGTVTGYTNLSGGEQSWTFETTTPGYSSSDIIYAGSIALDYGQVGSGSKGVWEVTVLDSAGSPYSQVQTWSAVTDGEPSTFTTLVRTGNLDGLAGIGLEYGLYAGQGLTASDAYVLVTDSQVDLHNIPLTFHDGSNTTIKLDPSTPSLAIGETIPTGFSAGDGIWAGLDSGSYKFRVGDVDGEQIYWDGSNIVVGNDSAEHIKSDGSQIQFMNGAVERANLSGDVWTLGNTSTEHVVVSATSVQLRDGATVHTDLAAGVLTIGDVGAGKSNIQITSGALKLRNNTIDNIVLDTDGSGFIAGGDLSWDASGNIDMTGTITITGGSGISNLTDAGDLATADDLDDVSDGITYGRVNVTAISDGNILLTSCVGNLDDIADGTYGKVLTTAISAGNILLSQASGNLDDISDGVYGKVLSTDISAGHILLSSVDGNLDDVSDGTTYGRVNNLDLSAGRISITSSSISDVGANADNTALNETFSSESDIDFDSIPDGTNFGKILNTDISAGHIVLSTTIGDLDDITDGTIYGRPQQTILDSGYVKLLRDSSGESQKIEITASGIDLYQNDGKLMAIESDAVKIYSPQSGAPLVTTDGDTLVTTDGDALVAGTDQRAEYGESMWVGAGSTQERLEWNTTDGLFIADPDGTKVFQITPAGVTTFSGAIDGATAAGVTLIDGDYLSTGLISADRIDTGTLSADRIGARSITAEKLNVSTLSSITADIGEVTTGVLRSPDSGTFLDLANQKLYFNEKSTFTSATDGIFIGYDTDGYKFNIGGDASYWKYDGAFEIALASGDSFDLAGDFSVLSGGSISLGGDNSAPGDLVFESENNIYMSSSSTGSQFGIYPKAEGVGRFYIGGQPGGGSTVMNWKFERITNYATDAIRLSCSDPRTGSDPQSDILLLSDATAQESSIELQAQGETTSSGILKVFGGLTSSDMYINMSIGTAGSEVEKFLLDSNGFTFKDVSNFTQTSNSTTVSVDSINLENLSTTGYYSPSIVFSQNKTNDNAIKLLSRYDRRFYIQKTDDDWVTEDSLLMLSGDVSIVYSDFRVEGHLDIKEVRTSPTTFSGYGRLYTKSDNKLYFKDGDGTEHEVAFV